MQTDLAEERELVRAMCAGDEAAFERFFTGYAPRVYRFVHARVGRDPQVTEELCQDVMSQAMQNIGRWRAEAGLFTWLCQMARNGAIDHWRRKRRRARIEVALDEDVAEAVAAVPADDSMRPDEEVSRAELLERVHRALERLPANHASALEWKYIEGCSVVEIGLRLGLNGIATQSLLARARQGMKIALQASCETALEDVLPFTRKGKP